MKKGVKIFIVLVIIAGVLWWGYTYRGWFQGATTNGAGERGLAYDYCISHGGTWGALPNGGLGCIYPTKA